MDEHCVCRMLVVERTAWTENNAGRRFVSCVNGRRGCKYFRWVDPPVCDRGHVFIMGLIRRIERTEEELEKMMVLQEKEKKKTSCCKCGKFPWLYLIVLGVVCFGLGGSEDVM